MPLLNTEQQHKLTRFAQGLVNQQQARVIVDPQEPASGFWFGGGNMIEDTDGTLYVVGRYRDAGDSRTGIAAGKRGWELAIFASNNRGESFEKVLGFSKQDLDIDGRKVLSIEGSALFRTESGFELFISTEKDDIGYPGEFESFLKPGTGVWTIEHCSAPTIEGLRDAPQTTILETDDPRFIHIKDPFVYEADNKDLYLLFCSHPFCWTSSNTGYAVRKQGEESFSEPVFDFFPRGFTWDVAMTRGTAVLDIPKVDAFQGQQVSLVFYDGGECVRNHDEHSHAITRPRGYSCEELGGAGYILNGDFSQLDRLSVHRPLFVSPHGTGCSRYVDVLSTKDGFYATWQQSQADGSQPLVMNFLSHNDAEQLLT